MGAIRRTLVLGAGGLLAASIVGCGTLPELPTSLPAIARAQDEPRLLPSVLDRKPPAWLVTGSTPFPTNAPAAAPAPPLRADLTPAQDSPVSAVPRVHEERSPANNSLTGLVPAVYPAPLPASPEADWRPAGELHSR